MMNNLLIKKAYILIFVLVGVISFAQSIPPPPETPESGDIGASPASPIDGYTFVLFLVALIMIVFITPKLKERVLR